MENNEKTEEVSRENAILIWQSSRLSISMKCEKAPEILKANGTVIVTLCNFSASIGKAKSKKPFNVSAIVAAALKGCTILLYSAELPENSRITNPNTQDQGIPNPLIRKPHTRAESARVNKTNKSEKLLRR